MKIIKSLNQILPLAIIFLGLLGYNYINAAWNNPVGPPPSNNANAPINVGDSISSFQPGKGTVQFDFLGARDTLVAGVEVQSPKVTADNITAGNINADTIVAEDLNVNDEVKTRKLRTDYFCNASGNKCASLAELLADRNTQSSGPLTQSGNLSFAKTRNDAGTQNHYTAYVTFPRPYQSAPTINYSGNCPIGQSVTATGFTLRYTISQGQIGCTQPQTWTAVGDAL